MRLSLNKNIIKDLYLQGYNASEITKKINLKLQGNIKKATVQKYIQRNLGNYKKQHEIKVVARRETKKATNYECNRFMSDKSFINKNRSIYKTLSNGDIVVNMEVAECITWDTPRRLTNENKNAI